MELSAFCETFLSIDGCYTQNGFQAHFLLIQADVKKAESVH